MSLKPISTCLAVLSVLFGLVLPFGAAALESDPRQPIEIEADLMTLDQQSGVSTYRGNVKLTQGSIRIAAKELILHTESGRLHRMEILGDEKTPAVFRQSTDDGEQAQGQARRIEYTAADSRMVLLGQAELLQGNNHIRSARIDYNTARNSFVAGRASEQAQTPPADRSDDRVRIIITPQKNR